MTTSTASPLDRAFEPFQLAGLTLRNRFIKTATFEGRTAAPSAASSRIAAGSRAPSRSRSAARSAPATASMPTACSAACPSAARCVRTKYQARQVRAAVDVPLAYLGGVTSGPDVEQLMREGFDLVCVGRALLHDPQWVRRLRDDPTHRNPCNRCNLCVAAMATPQGTHCVLRAP